MPGFGIVCYCKGEVRSARLRAELIDGLVTVRVEASAFGRRERGVFDPELEAAVSAYGGDEVRVDCGREPLYLRSFQK